jgi:hypothetical protein
MVPAKRYVFILVSLSLMVSGCNKEIPAPPHATKKTTPKPAIKGVSLDRLKPSWEGKYAVEQDSTSAKFEREFESHKIVFDVTHDEDGNVSRIAGKAIGPFDAFEERGQAFAAMLADMLDAIGLKNDSSANAHMEIGVLRGTADFAYSFRQDQIEFFLAPDRKGDGGNVERVLNVLPVKGASVGMPAIPGSSVEQLQGLFAGFDVLAKLDNKELVLIRQQESHADIVHCYTNEKGQIRRVEAFLANVKEGAPVDELRKTLWLKLGDLEYEGSDPADAKDFISGKKLAYAAGDGRDVGRAVFYSQVNTKGERASLEVFYCMPK